MCVTVLLLLVAVRLAGSVYDEVWRVIRVMVKGGEDESLRSSFKMAVPTLPPG